MQDYSSQKARNLKSNGFYFNRAYYVQQALLIIKPHWKILMAFTGAYLGSLFLVLLNPQIGQIVQMVISGPISAGYYLSIKKILDGKQLTFNDFLEGFQNFVPTMLVFMMVNLLTTIGLALYYLPAVFVATIYLFAMPMVVFGKMNFWEAMESSRVIIMEKFWDALLLILTIVGINILGLLTFGVGVLFTLPLSYAIILVAYQDIYGFEEESEPSHNDFSHFR